MKTSTMQMERMNLRRNRAMALASAIMQKVEPFICEHEHHHGNQNAYRAIVGLLEEIGADVVTDELRAYYGLPPRGPDGWTMEEVLALEKMRLEAMTRPLGPTILKSVLNQTDIPFTDTSQ